MPKGILNPGTFLALPFAIALIGCDPLRDGACACSKELRMNVCVEGKYEGMDSVVYRRQRSDAMLDSLLYPEDRCFPEHSGRQRILVFGNGERIDSSAWFDLRTVDCCHAEGKTVAF